MNELRFYDMKIENLGSDTEDFDDDGAEEAEIQRMLNKGLDDEDEMDRNPLEVALANLEGDERLQERRQIYDKESSITDFQVEPEVESCSVDFYKKPYAEPMDVRAAVEMENEPLIPINYYDNDDGFWTKHIEEKIERWD